ncbi:hypothetical protein BGZ63DRAFT_333816, partial [Mariannaea sp. PMI_226]
MNETTAHLLKPARHPAPSPPPKNRLTDDILAHLAPRTVVDALTTATGTLRSCLNGAPMSERDFVMRTAIASKTIWEWVEELQSWPWPSESGSGGFEMPSTKRRGRSDQVANPDENDDDYMGSLLVTEVSAFERRLAQIQHELDSLEIEDIKAHVLNNHILPLSRPGTPFAEFTRAGVLSNTTYNRMEDLTAVVTAIVVKALPNLAKLTRLSQTWTLRMSVLRRVPTLLLAIEDAEVALKSGWNAISIPTRKTQQEEEDSLPRASTLMRRDFDVMKLVLEKKISQPGHSLDYMLDCLEGLPDTLPDEWLDRMEAVERSYAEWVAACETKIRETEWAKVIQAQAPIRSPSPVKTSTGIATDASESFSQSNDFVPEISSDTESTMSSDVEIGPIPLRLPRPQPSTNGRGDPRKISGTSEAETVVFAPPKNANFPNNGPESPSLIVTEHGDESQSETFDSTGDSGFHANGSQPSTPSIKNHSKSIAKTPNTPEFGSIIDSEVVGDTPSFIRDGSPELPPLRPLKPAIRNRSDTSRASTITRRASSHFDGMSSDILEMSVSPDLRRARVREQEYLQASPPSSPPLPEADSRESSMTPFDSPLIIPRIEDDYMMVNNNAIDDSFNDDFDDSFSLSEFSYDRRGSVGSVGTVGDQHLQRQIKEIISNIPAKIKLSNEFPPINLNPPDLQLPKIRKRPSVEPFKRSTSSVSSRAGTPSFTLSPDKTARSRSRGKQEIKVYHLSRSTGEAPIKLFIRCVGEQGERVMVRVGGGWADLGEYLKEYASHHKRRSVSGLHTKVEVKEQPHVQPSSRRSNMGSSPSARPASALEFSPMSPLAVRKTRRSVGATSHESPHFLPKTPAPIKAKTEEDHSSEESQPSRPGSRLDWTEDDSSFLGLAGPTGKKVEMSEENKAWVESVKEKVRLASGERRIPSTGSQFGELGKVGGTKRLFRRNEERRESRG